MVEPLKSLRAPRFWLRLRHAMNRNTRRGSRRNIAAHYDLGNEFYQQWLDPGMTYSAGLFSSMGQTLEQAQDAKLDRVLGLLDLAGGDNVLEIGCGWGSLAERMMERHDCTVTGVTLSSRAIGLRAASASIAIWTNALISACKTTGTCAAPSIGSSRSKCWRRSARPIGRLTSRTCGIVYVQAALAVLQVITIDDDRFEDYRRSPDFIQKYIFPGGMLPTVEIIERETAKAGLTLVAKQFFGDSYARTLEEWRRRFLESWPAIEALGF